MNTEKDPKVLWTWKLVKFVRFFERISIKSASKVKAKCCQSFSIDYCVELLGWNVKFSCIWGIDSFDERKKRLPGIWCCLWRRKIFLDFLHRLSGTRFDKITSNEMTQDKLFLTHKLIQIKFPRSGATEKPGWTWQAVKGEKSWDEIHWRFYSITKVDSLLLPLSSNSISSDSGWSFSMYLNANVNFVTNSSWFDYVWWATCRVFNGTITFVWNEAERCLCWCWVRHFVQCVQSIKVFVSHINFHQQN